MLIFFSALTIYKIEAQFYFIKILLISGYTYPTTFSYFKTLSIIRFIKLNDKYVFIQCV